MSMFLIAESFAAAGIVHAFSTRAGDREHLPELLEGVGVAEDSLATGRQVHGDRVVWIAPGQGPHEAGCDGLATREPGQAVGVLTADCVPVLLADTRGRVVCAVHSGWRGTVARIVVRALEALRDEAGVVPADLLVAIGPAIGGSCYEVSDEVADAVCGTLGRRPEDVVRRGERGRPHVDLRQAVRHQLIASGVTPASIELVGGCTACEPAVFYSHRRDGAKAGRHVSLIQAVREQA